MTLNVAVVCRQLKFEHDRIKNGAWSYPVPDLEWSFFPVTDGEVVNKNKLAKQGFDLIVWDDWVWNTWEGTSAIPVYAVIVDSNTSARRRKRYLGRATYADVLLIDQDRLKVFAETGKPVYRWQYAVNEQVFAPGQKSIDVAYHVGRTDERWALIDSLQALCREQGYSLTVGGNLTIDQYAVRLGAARIVVHKATHEQCRSHRFFDALAAGACLLTDRVWSVAEDGFIPGKHFVEWETPEHLHQTITALLDTGRWNSVAQAGYGFVLAHHTWRQRAAEFVQIVEGTHVKH